MIEGGISLEDAKRPVGRLVPREGPGRRALSALVARRLADVRRLLGGWVVEDPAEAGWKSMLEGLLHLEEGRTVQAESALLGAVSMATIEAVKLDVPVGMEGGEGLPALGVSARYEAWRLLAECLHTLGLVYRRQDLPAAALEAHGAALRLRERFGSAEECWESLISLGLDAELAGAFEEAAAHYRRAEVAGGRCAEEPLRKQAAAAAHAAEALSSGGRHAEAAAAARAARDLWRRHDVTGADFACAELHLGRTLLRWGEALLGASGEAGSGGSGGEGRGAAEVVGEAVTTLSAARDALLAFGPAQHGAAQECAELCDFAGRLAAMSETAPGL